MMTNLARPITDSAAADPERAAIRLDDAVVPYALAGNTASANGAALPYANPGALLDVTSGSNGTCSPSCAPARAGYDGPTGRGTPSRGGAF